MSDINRYLSALSFLDKLSLNLHTVSRLADLETPLSMYLKLRYAYSDAPMFLLESAEQHEMLGRYSFIGANPFLTLKVHGTTLELKGVAELKLELESTEEVFQLVKYITEKVRKSVNIDFEDKSAKIDVSIIPMALVVLNYESVRYFEEINFDKDKQFDSPDISIIFPSVIVVFDNYRRLMWNIMVHIPVQSIAEVNRELSLIEKYPISFREFQDTVASEIRFQTPKDEFCRKVERAKRYIYDGDIFQVVLSQRFYVDTKEDALSLYRKLRLTNPSPYMFLIQSGDFSLFGSSPETLVKLNDGKVIVHPIAGTRKRGSNSQEDEMIMKELLSDEKELAEHSMLVDLARNDVGRIAVPGTVKVPRLMYIEKYSHVMHIVSEVQGMLDKKFDTFDVLRSTFPAGTVTGAPKIRAMEIIEELEDTSREFYAGSVGYISWSNNADFAITIRSALLKDGRLYTQAGAGIVYDSVPENEYNETLSKAQAIFKIASVKISEMI